MIQPKDVSALDAAFPTSVRDYLPAYRDVPDEYKHGDNPYAKFISLWFFTGADLSRLVARDGIDADAALRHLKYCMGSWEPKHEHKEAGCAMLLHEWFTIKEAK